MKSPRVMFLLMLVALSAAAFAQSEAQKTNVQKSEAEKSFDAMKALSGSWEGSVTVDPPQPDMKGGGKPMHISLRTTSRGNALVHEMQVAGTPLDPAKYDHPVTMFYVENDQLLLTHYCDAGNRPRMVGKISPDGKKVEFEFLDLSGGNKYGHMYHAVFTPIDADHHVEDWTYMMPGDKPIHAHFDLHRINDGSAASGK
jgi:hypothetical protein